MVVGLSSAQFTRELCGGVIRITFKGRTVEVQITESNLSGPLNSLNVAPEVFRALTGSLDRGVAYGDWIGMWFRRGSQRGQMFLHRFELGSR